MRICLLPYLFSLLVTAVQASPDERLRESLEVGIFTAHHIMSFDFIPAQGSYAILDEDDGLLMKLSPPGRVRVAAYGRHAAIFTPDTTLYVSGELRISGRSWENFFILQPEGLPYRMYDDELLVRPGPGKLILVNRVALDNYVAGVVEAESGLMRHPEYYKVQAIIARTYAIRNDRANGHRHYGLCDGVHCQAYYGRTAYARIIDAVSETRGDVVVDGDGQLINAVYHANCGGETVASENVWLQSESYLKSVRDTFCLDQPGARWQARVSRQELLDYLHGEFSITPGYQEQQQLMHFAQSRRLHHLDPFGSVRLPRVRNHFQWRSAYFSFYPQNGKIHVEGRGYGHGVGLCQEGAMQMAISGYPKHEIIRFYYQGTRIHTLY